MQIDLVVKALQSDSTFVAIGWTWVCFCLVGFVFSLRWPHQCDIANCGHKVLENRKK